MTGSVNTADGRAFSAVVFDFDGLVIASEQTALLSWQDLYARFGLVLPLEKWVKLIGTWGSEWSPAVELRETVGNGHDWDAIERERRAWEIAASDELPMLPGVAACIDEAAALGLRLAVASSSPRAWVAHHLERLGVIDRFELLVTLDDVERAKPDPALFRLAVERLGVSAAEAFALEDSLHGITSAKLAGLRCVAVPNPLLADADYSAADVRVDSLEDTSLAELAELLAR